MPGRSDNRWLIVTLAIIAYVLLNLFIYALTAEPPEVHSKSTGAMYITPNEDAITDGLRPIDHYSYNCWQWTGTSYSFKPQHCSVTFI